MITLVLGGARSGKSDIAERLVSRLPAPVTYIATATIADDEEWGARVARHRDRRPSDWKTVEAGSDVLHALRSATERTVLLDALRPWAAAHAAPSLDPVASLAALLPRRAPPP